ncbi:MAG: MotA/TolQ/ExbB proton channel family protein [Pirellulales bacterium]|nr:MotA/TolQ/ExbB proton channel family protein [Pirellulales bacterium]
MVSLMRAAMAQWPDAAQPSSASSPANPAAGQADFQPGTAGPVNDPNAVEAPGDAKGASQSFWEILKAGGVVGLLILLLSIVGVALAIEHLMTIRARVLMPEGLADDVRHLLAEGNMAAADERCRRQPSFLAFVLAAGLVEIEGGWSAVEKAMEDATADQSARLLRKVEYLSVIGNIAPMLGLLGTVIGMIFAFHQVADTQGAARAADLATGIYLALVTTVEGLIVAIPALGAFAVFRNRVDQLVAETAYAALHALGPLKRRAGARRAVEAAPPLPPGLPRGGRA